MRFFVFSVFLAILIPGPLPLCTQEGSCTHQTLTVNLLDRTGAPVPDCDLNCFQATYRKKPARILSVIRPTSPARVVLLLDVSGSMDMRGKWDTALLAARDIFKATPLGTAIAFIAFESEVVEMMNFDRGNSAVLSALEALKAGRYKIPPGRNKTAIYDAILQGVRILGPPRPGDAVYLITDGGDNASHAKLDQTEEALLESGIRLFTVVLEIQRNRTPEELPEIIEGLARNSGGYPVRIRGGLRPVPGLQFDPNPEFLAQVETDLQKLFLQITSYYRVELETAEPPTKLENWKLEMAPAEKDKVRGAQLTYPRRLVPCVRNNPPSKTK